MTARHTRTDNSKPPFIRVLCARVRFAPCLVLPVIFRAEDSPRGLWRSLGKRVGCKPSRVRIPHPPPHYGAPNRSCRGCPRCRGSVRDSRPVTVTGGEPPRLACQAVGAVDALISRLRPPTPELLSASMCPAR